MKQKWLNVILHLTGLIHRKKEALIYATMAPSIGIAIQIIFLELYLLLVSVPFYLVVGEKFTLTKGKQDKEVVSYQLRRKFFNSIVFLIILIWIIKIVLNVFFMPTPVISNNFLN